MSTNGQYDDDQELPLPSAQVIKVTDSISVQPPLSRCGRGPGLVILLDKTIPADAVAESINPPPQQKWAEEGWAVAQIDVTSSSNDIQTDLREAIDSIRNLPEYDGNARFGLITYLSEAHPSISTAIQVTPEIKALVSYGSARPTSKTAPHLLHSAGPSSASPSTYDTTTAKTHLYPSASPFFVLPTHSTFHSPSASVSHTRTLAFLKPLLNGPFFDLEAIWEEHTLYEFRERAVAKTMSTMVQEPYVNHIPTMTGGIGRAKLTKFYREHFIFANPEDTVLELVSRTVGVDRVIDEFIFAFTHDRVIDWLLPGLPPTHLPVRVPFTSIVNLRGDRLYHEHIAWDQASVLVQLGLMPEYLPFPYPVEGREPAPGKRFEYRVPAAGVETARKLVDEGAVESNEMFGYGVREVDV